MEYLQAKATAAPTTDLGQFKALVATYDRDRQGDVIQFGAFSKTIFDWRNVGRVVPLHWNHAADQIIGEVYPDKMRETKRGLEVSGRVDLDDELGVKVWKQLKANRLGFSFGYAVTKSSRRRGGGRDLFEIDLFEVSATPSPANNQTRVLETKSDLATDWRDVPRYRVRGHDRPLSYHGLMAHQDVQRAVKEIEREEREAEAAERKAAEKARVAIPTTDKPFVTDDGKRLLRCSAEGCNRDPDERDRRLAPGRGSPLVVP